MSHGFPQRLTLSFTDKKILDMAPAQAYDDKVFPAFDDTVLAAAQRLADETALRAEVQR